ncbi:hypothetical protein BO71DRAFT_448645 [Aspergillus ellipticus CBS 707.79]|uniref:Zn(2)-C6 fungal-type domain-containing protein n=1 Tax=Aspergillus ellipticus CBS 707.79 TaxID=1448320 RepID=A0A319EXM1_9EURO|nr:hypothetical protein BO71DRAFT_448645 [Aspergillus ellipticus CBS 707.79]
MESSAKNYAATVSHGGAGRKRPRTSGMYQRKRAIAACLPCRARKTKCDNIRPTCGFCANHDAQCTYADTANDHSSFDPASLAILERINHAVALLEAQSATAPEHAPTRQSQRWHQPAVMMPSLSHAHEDSHSVEISDDLLVETPGFPARSHNCEAILKWPIFRDRAPDVWSLVLENDESVLPAATQAHPIALGRGIQEEQIVPLSETFLSHVHLKNPILEVSGFTQYVRDAAENGLRWDGPSCLVLIACALGCLASPFQSSHDSRHSLTTSTPMMALKEASAAYYLAAKKRLGLIEPSFLGVQCHFLCDVLEMYFLNAMRAWHYFNQACVQLQNLLLTSSYTRTGDEGHIPRETQRLEQRLYWSCMKSECELRCEIPLPTSGIGRFGFPDMLPSPPAELLSPLPYSSGGQETGSSSLAEQEEERSWFYYLAEISFRRLMNQTLATIGGNGEASWVDNIQQIFINHHVFEEQIDSWCAHIPPQISVEQAGDLDNELAHFIHQRAMVYREWIHRPFLYYIIHQPLNDPFAYRAMPLAKRCLQLCVETQYMIQPFHRHHGSWFMARNSLARALLLIAATLSKRIEMPDDWKQAADHSLQNIHYWAEEAEDLARAESILKDILATV